MQEPVRLNAALTSALLRITALPVERSGPTRVELDLHDAGSAEQYLRELTADPHVREAIAVSSPSLTRTLDALEAGRAVDPKKLRRAVLAVTSYLLRMTTRPTPFGLLAGVATARFGPRATVRLGGEHHKGVRPDAGWLAEQVSRAESDLATVRSTRVVLNNLCTVRGDRLVLSYVPGRRELSVRHTPLVREAARLARRPIPFTDLVRRLDAAFEQATPDRIEPLLLELVGRRLLLTELAPPPSAPDPLAYLRARLPDDPVLARTQEAIQVYAGRPVGAGLQAWRATTAHPHVDLAYDADVVLPVEVAAEVERAATVLARLTPPDQTPAYLRHYHLDFLERYGEGPLVPLLELLDAASGLGAPAGYEIPLSTRQAPPEAREPTARDRLLGALAQQAAADGSAEVVLDDAELDRLAPDDADDRFPPELEIGVQVVADSLAALDCGDFQIVVGGPHSPRAGAIGGRFTYLLDRLELGPPDPPGAVTAQLEFEPARPASRNLTRVPRQLGHTLAAGVFADPAETAVVGVDELLVGANLDRFYLWSERLGAEVVPATFHMLDSSWLAPNAVRFLRELAAARLRACTPWDWGMVGELLPYLPRVRHGRAVLSPASWRLDPALADPDLFGTWRKRWRVPATVYLTYADNRIGLDLDTPLHQALLRHELSRRPDAMLVEPAAGGRLGTGWLNGHAHELVVTLRSRQPDPVVRAPARTPPAPQRRHYPGGEWTYAKLYAPEDRHPHLVAHSLHVLRSALPDGVDRWFFVRYRDPEPQLRIRVHGPAGAVVPVLHDWAAELCEARLAQRLVLDTYEPEVTRYGGPGALEAAERAFHADSEAVIDQLRLDPAANTELLLAAGMADLAAAYGGPDWREWFLAAYPKDAGHAAFQAIRREALAVIADGIVDPRLVEIWRRRSGAIRAYGELVRRLDPGGPSPLGSLLHMHHNRIAGIAPDVERAVYGIVRGALQAQADRSRAASR